MACTERYAEAWEFASFFCVEAMLSGYDNSGGGPNAFLTDTLASFFPDWQIEPGKGMVLYNLTTGLSGPVTAADRTTLTATGVTWTDVDRWRITPLTATEQAVIEHYLDVTANDMHVALAAVGACDCALASWAEEYLKKLNIVEAGAFHQCSCAKPGLSDDERTSLLAWADRQLELIRTGKYELCADATGGDWPSIGWASQSLTERNAARIIANAIKRESG